MCAQSYLTLCNTLSVGLSRQKYWSGFPFPSLGDLLDPGTEPESPETPALVGGFFTPESPAEKTPIPENLI